MKKNQEITVMTNNFSNGQYVIHVMLNGKDVEFSMKTIHDLRYINQDEDYFDFEFQSGVSEDAKAFFKLLALKSVFSTLDESCLNINEYGLNVECMRTYLYKTENGALNHEIKYAYKGDISFV